MLDILVQLCNFLVYSLQLLLYYSSKAGQATFYLLTIIYNQLGNFLGILISFLKVAFEDFLTFLSDIWDYTLGTFQFIDAIVTYFIDFIHSVGTSVVSVLFRTFDVYTNCLKTAFCAIIYSVKSAVTFFKWILVALGSGVWFLVTLIPNLFLSVITFLFDSLKLAYEETFILVNETATRLNSNTKAICNFILDVPLESAAGLLSTICIGYVLMQFHIQLTRSLRQSTVHLIQLITFGLQQLRQKFSVLFLRNTSNNIDSQDGIESEDSNRETEQLFCIICQERKKCILFLPCKHVCVCNECYNRLKGFNRRCPICRTDIKRTMKVFL